MKNTILLLFTLIVSCATVPNKNVPQEFPHQELIKGSNGGYYSPKNMIIRNHSDLKIIYTQINKIRKPGFPIPEIDFEKEIVIALFLGQRSSGGYTISISKIVETKDEIQVYTQNTEPDGPATTVMTQPFYFCKIPATEKTIVFK